MNFYEKYITSLNKNEVFQFGSNMQGFHGGGSAGFASFNKAGNHWREEKYGEKPNGWRGCWNVKGVSEGFQAGTIGKSYAIPTVSNAGMKRSLSPETISNSIRSFYAFCRSQPTLKFFVAQDAKMGLNGYSGEEMAKMYATEEPPSNVFFYKPFGELIEKQIKNK